MLQTETVVILHHAVEMLLRLFYAHVENNDCPWLEVASLVNFAEFKGKVGQSLNDGFGRTQIAQVFLGGSSPEDACIALSQEEFDDAIDGYDLLLTECGNRFMSEAFLYNAIKHGLSTVALDPSTEIGMSQGDKKAVIHKGALFAYMHKARYPGAPKGGPEWFMSMAGVKTEQDLALAILVARAVESLWDVARRKYTGKSGSIRQMKKSTAELAIYGVLTESPNVIGTITMEMPKLKADGSIDGVNYDLRGTDAPEGYEPDPGFQIADCPRINLPARQRDARIYSTSSRKLYPFSPNGSQQV
ncbi:hypothetical protein A7U43_18395 [Mycobacterium adipatum]|uniref:Uncharacterized protein n=1 Tax=Mycobacterium adipatum TaxID=1682113 RepID=A0A172UP76_9MYCO|nr:hypothetical protein [Mycobacterium adipatum]ANE80997.1 hypothetical protein A7U43_18395 [Mycobacterium adipatum]